MLVCDVHIRIAIVDFHQFTYKTEYDASEPKTKCHFSLALQLLIHTNFPGSAQRTTYFLLSLNKKWKQHGKFYVVQTINSNANNKLSDLYKFLIMGLNYSLKFKNYWVKEYILEKFQLLSIWSYYVHSIQSK